jgi:hypothetical protein
VSAATTTGSVELGALAPGDRFTATSGTSWTLERHAGEVSWAVRHVVSGEKAPDTHWQGGPVGDGERDRFSPRVLVARGWGQAVPAQRELVR